MSRQQQLIEGLDAYLQQIGKDLPVGSKIRLRLVQGPLPVSSIDPVETSSSTANATNANTTSSSSSIPQQSFPSILKFPPSSTQPPNFTKAPWHTGQGRLHIENVPKPQEDSDDEEDSNHMKPSKAGGGNSEHGEGGMISSSVGNVSSKPVVGKKRWKYNRNVIPVKQWVVQDQVDFLETMVYRRKQLKYQKLLLQYRKRRILHPNETGITPPTAPIPPTIRATRYVGIPERMTSHHVLFTLQPPKSSSSPQQQQEYDYDDYDDDQNTATITVRTLPSIEQSTMVPMTQPAVRSHSAFATLSNAAQVMEDQRFAMSSTAASLAFRNARPNMLGGNENSNDATTTTTLRVGGIRKINKTQSRLLQKLQQKEKANKNSNAADEEDGDDVMADVAYKERKGGGGGARRELLSTLGDGLKVSDDGVVLGGTNDALFGGRGLKFNRLAVAAEGNATSAGNDIKTERGADGAAMSDDFYTRDVGAEYEEMDYDAAEQFDDDDVDVGETEVQNVGTDGYNEDEYDDDDNDDDSDDMNEDDDDAIGGAEGLASMAGYKALLAKARGEIQATTTTTEKVDENTNANSSGTTGTAALSSTSPGDENNTKRSVSPKPDKGNKNVDEKKPIDHLAKKMAAAEKTAQALKEKQQQQQQPTIASSSSIATGSANGGATTNNMSRSSTAAPQVDEHGLRLITLDAVRKEIWLNHGSIPINRLIKIFNANKKHGEIRQNQLKEVIKELCTMTTDPIHGRVLVLKQHYSHMS